MQKQGYSFRLSSLAINYLTYCAELANMSVGKYLDFMLRSLAVNDGFYRPDADTETDIDNQL